MSFLAEHAILSWAKFIFIGIDDRFRGKLASIPFNLKSKQKRKKDIPLLLSHGGCCSNLNKKQILYSRTIPFLPLIYSNVWISSHFLIRIEEKMCKFETKTADVVMWSSQTVTVSGRSFFSFFVFFKKMNKNMFCLLTPSFWLQLRKFFVLMFPFLSLLLILPALSVIWLSLQFVANEKSSRTTDMETTTHSRRFFISFTSPISQRLKCKLRNKMDFSAEYKMFAIASRLPDKVQCRLFIWIKWKLGQTTRDEDTGKRNQMCLNETPLATTAAVTRCDVFFCASRLVAIDAIE